jgi:hypothetical protein
MAIERNSFEVPVGEIPIPVYADEPVVSPTDPDLDDYFARISGAEEDVAAIDLTDEDRTYLRLKWGKTYKPEEWI